MKRGTPIRVEMNEDDLRIVKAAAKIVGVRPASFVIGAARQRAYTILKKIIEK